MRTYLPLLASFTVLSFCAQIANAQLKVRYITKTAGTVCYLDSRSMNTMIPPPESYRQVKAGARTKSANINVSYEGFTADAQGAFEAAVSIWESLLTSDVSINVLARWAPLASGVLGGASSGGYIMNFDGAQRTGVWYPIALAEKMARKNLNGSNPDIVATFNSNNANWHYGLEGSNPPTGKYDLMSVVLHEIGHGLGISKSYEVSGAVGNISSFFNGRPVVYETNLESADSKNLVTTFTAPSADLGAQLTSTALFYNSPLVQIVNSSLPAKIFAPSTFVSGSSIAHLDEVTYPGGSPNSLMTPNIGASERILDPGPIVMQILKEMGWITTFIEHTPLKGTEDNSAPFAVTCSVTSNTSFDPSTLSLNYSTDGSNFTTVSMTPTGAPAQFSAFIPNGNPKYHYFIKVTDGDSRVITKPGTAYVQGSPTTQGVFTFEVGPDLKSPLINHVPVTFMAAKDTLRIEAVISDNLGVLEAKLDWDINGVVQAQLPLSIKSGTDSTYNVGIIFPGGTLANGDKIHYRITAKDIAVAGNTTSKPTPTTFYEVNVTGLAAAQDTYTNNFDGLSDADFFGSGFSIIKPTGFENGAIHSQHPYPEGDGSPGDQLNFIYNLRTPIKIKEANATVKFDEIVLVEPGETGAPFGSQDFFDYVVVEASKDGGITWSTVADGWDSRDKPEWLSHYMSAITGQISNAVGHPGLYRTRTLDLLSKFTAKDVVAIRFRMFSDPFAAGWGWAIDNLNIQVDTQAPTILHQHSDHIVAGATQFEVKSKITDESGLERVMVEHKVNDGSVTTSELIVNPGQDLFNVTLNFPALVTGDNLFYRIRAVDSLGNTSVYPATEFLQLASIGLSSPVDFFASDFSTAADIVGNFFSVEPKEGFFNGAVHSQHPYLEKIGPDPSVTNYSFLVRKPIKVSATNPFMVFDEVVLTEYNGSDPVDFLVVEASKDGVTWEKLVAEHAANYDSRWKAAYDAGGTGSSSLFFKRIFQITESGKFKPGDVILIRFRLQTNGTKSGWGLAVDNLSIQGPATGTHPVMEGYSIYPNPATADEVFVRLSPGRGNPVGIRLLNAHGKALHADEFLAAEDVIDHRIETAGLADGLYLINIATSGGTFTAKFIRKR